MAEWKPIIRQYRRGAAHGVETEGRSYRLATIFGDGNQAEVAADMEYIAKAATAHQEMLTLLQRAAVAVTGTDEALALEIDQFIAGLAGPVGEP